MKTGILSDPDPNAAANKADAAIPLMSRRRMLATATGACWHSKLRAVAETSEEDFNNVINANVIGTANSFRAALPHLLSRKCGRIVIISSGQGRHGFMDGSAYSASKWALIGLMKSAAWEVGKSGITVNCVEPGLVDTPLTRNPGRWRALISATGKQPPQNPTGQEAIAAAAPSAVMGIAWMQPDEVAPAVVFLCTDAANRVSGATYDATAGESAKYTA